VTHFSYLKISAAGKYELICIKTVLPWIRDKKWAILYGVYYLLRISEKATAILSWEQYSTFVSVLPVLYQLKHYILDPYLFN
jgi:hypothetical protein